MAKIPNFKLGATGKFPEGKLDGDDEGELALAVVADHDGGVVRLMFGKKITWLGLPSTLARQLAAMLIKQADDLDARKH